MNHPTSQARTVRSARTMVWALASLGVATAVVLPLVGSTNASLTDIANTNTAIGASDLFDIGLVQDGIFREAEGDGVAWELGASQFVPGSVVETLIPVVNNGPFDADIVLRVEDVYDEAAVSGVDPFALYRWSITDADTGELLVGSADPLVSPVDGSAVGDALPIFRLAARGATPVADGASWSDAALGSVRNLRVSVAYPDTAESAAYNGGSSRIRLLFSAVSATTD